MPKASVDMATLKEKSREMAAWQKLWGSKQLSKEGRAAFKKISKLIDKWTPMMRGIYGTQIPAATLKEFGEDIAPVEDLKALVEGSEV